MEEKVRPYWHVDMKWICTLLLFPVFILTVFCFNLSLLTEETRAKQLSTYAVAAMFSPKGLDDAEDLDKFKKELEKSKKDSIQIPNFNITISKEELNSLSPRELRLKIFSQMVDPIYGKDKNAVKKLTNNPEAAEGIDKNIGVMEIFTERSHLLIQKIFYILSAISLLLMAMLIFFSYGFGRFLSPSIVFLITGLPGYLAMLIASKLTERPKAASGEEMMQRVNYLLSEVLPIISKTALPVYFWVSIFGGVLLLICIIGKIVLKVKKPVIQ